MVSDALAYPARVGRLSGVPVVVLSVDHIELGRAWPDFLHGDQAALGSAAFHCLFNDRIDADAQKQKAADFAGDFDHTHQGVQMIHHVEGLSPRCLDGQPTRGNEL